MHTDALIALLLLPTFSMAQTTIYGSNTQLTGNATVINAATARIYVVFPPQSDQSPAKNNTNFKANVMTQGAIDGVTVPVLWSVVETSAPTTTPCSPQSDVCQADLSAAGYFHIYSWSAVDGTGCSDTNSNSISQWFCDFPLTSGHFKKVNLILYGISNSPTNSATPSYVTQAWWSAATGFGATQDVVNTISTLGTGTSGCSQYTGSVAPPGATASFTGDNTAPNSTINVNWVTTHPFVNGDVIWVSGVGTAFDITAQNGRVVTVDSPTKFHYTGSGQTGATVIGPSATIIKAVDSWPVPFETPYSAAYLSFLRAAIYHFNHSSVFSQIGYIRPGVSRGGEAFPICKNRPPMTGATPPFSESVWNGWYTSVNSGVQNASPQVQILYSINSGDPASPNADYSTQQAGIAISYSNSVGMFNGFGSQGLAQSDTGFVSGNCPDDSTTPDTGNNWGCMFLKYWSAGTIPTTVPLELQQVDCSNPTTYTAGSGTCFHNGLPGSTLSLATLYPFAKQNHATIFELYSQDALLAYDPKYCDPDTTNQVCKNTTGFDWFDPAIGPDTQYNFYVNAGQYGSCGSSCPYAAVLNATHGH